HSIRDEAISTYRIRDSGERASAATARHLPGTDIVAGSIAGTLSNKIAGPQRQQGPYSFAAAACWKPGEPLNSLTIFPSATFHTFTSPFQPPEAIHSPLGLNANA